MPREIDRQGVKDMARDGAQIVEVLPENEYEEDHLPGAISVPLRRIEGARDILDANRPVIVYCWDTA